MCVCVCVFVCLQFSRTFHPGLHACLLFSQDWQLFLSMQNSALFVKDKLQELQCEPLIVELDTELREQLLNGSSPSLLSMFMPNRATDIRQLGEAAMHTVSGVASSISRCVLSRGA